VSDRDDIADVLVRYASGIDTKDWPLFRSCFTDDVHADYGDIGDWHGVDAITEWMAATHRDMPATNHMITNVAIEVSGAGDTARASSYVHAVLVVTPDRTHSVDAVGRYDDELVHTPDGWRIERRTFTMTRQVLT
jgi:3-phenylpropionate/cinnamic acid dioxygenase small subunit